MAGRKPPKKKKKKKITIRENGLLGSVAKRNRALKEAAGLTSKKKTKKKKY